MAALRIGFACAWDERDPKATWSYTPWSLRNAMRAQTEVLDIDLRIPPRAQQALKALHARRRGGRWVTTWRQSRVTDAYLHRLLTRGAQAVNCDAVLEIGDLAIVDKPFFLYQDLSFDTVLQASETGWVPPEGLTRDELRRRRDRQHRVYARATAVFAMSHWLRRSLIEQSGLPAEKVHVLHPGRAVVAADDGTVPVRDRDRERPRRRLLFVGGDFVRKGGDIVVAALAMLRRDVDPDITLTVVGPRTWPMRGDVPAGVEFLGRRPREDVARLYDMHDLFVMPSRLEGFGIAFAEAAARGLPCVGRDAYAMPEIIERGVTGELVSGDDPGVLAAVVAKALADDSLYENCRERAGAIGSWFSWDRAGREAVDLVARSLGRHEPGPAGKLT